MTDTSRFGSDDLATPAELRGPLHAHLEHLREAYLRRGWGARGGFGSRPALVVIDMALFWLDPKRQIGSNLTPVLDGVCTTLKAARAAQIPIFFTTFDYDPAHPPSPQNRKLCIPPTTQSPEMFELDPRLERRPNEKIVKKRYASAFKATYFHDMLVTLGVDTLIVTGVSTSHCVYATCRDATDTFRVVVPREAVGERCELMHDVFLTDIGIDLADVLPVAEVTTYLQGLSTKK